MRYSDDIKREIRDRIDIVELISEYLTLKRSGGRFLALCPFHDEKTPSFSVNGDLKIYKCFGCGKGGDVFRFLMEMENLSFPEAIRRLARRANVALEISETTGERELLYRVNRMASIFYHRLLTGSKIAEHARRYLHERGIEEPHWDTFKLGLSPPGWDRLLKLARTKRVPDRIVESSGLAVRSRKTGNLYDRFRGRLMFPIRDASGRVVAFGGRILGDGEPKYLNSSESDIFRKSSTLYGYDSARKAIRETRRAVVVEGYTDVIACHSRGLVYAVAAMGTSLTTIHLKHLQNLAGEVILIFDGDNAGRAAAERARDLVGRSTLQGVKVLVLPDGEDPDSYLRNHGQAGMENLLESSVPLLEYLLDRRMAGRDITTPEGKSQVIRDIAPILFREGDPVVREEYVKQLADRLRMKDPTIFPEQAFRASLQRFFERKRPDRTGDQFETLVASDTLYEKAEKIVLNIVLSQPAMYERAAPVMESLYFQDPVRRKLVELMRNKFDSDESFDWKKLLDSEEQAVIDQVTYLLMFLPSIQQPDKLMDNCISMLQLRKLKKDRQYLDKEIEQSITLIEQGREDELERSLELRKQLLDLEKKIHHVEETIDYDYLIK